MASANLVPPSEALGGPTVREYLTRMSPDEVLMWMAIGGRVPEQVREVLRRKLESELIGYRFSCAGVRYPGSSSVDADVS